MSRVLVFGTFDELHPGHESVLEQASELGTELIIAVSRDKTVLELKDRQPKLDEQTRLKLLQDHELVSKAILCDPDIGSFAVIKDVEPDMIALGYDQDKLELALKDWLAEHYRGIKIVKLKPFQPDKFKTSYVRH